MQFDISYNKKPGRALAATLQSVDLPKLQRAALEEAVQQPLSPAEQLAVIRAERGTNKRRGSDIEILPEP